MTIPVSGYLFAIASAAPLRLRRHRPRRLLGLPADRRGPDPGRSLRRADRPGGADRARRGLRLRHQPVLRGAALRLSPVRLLRLPRLRQVRRSGIPIARPAPGSAWSSMTIPGSTPTARDGAATSSCPDRSDPGRAIVFRDADPRREYVTRVQGSESADGRRRRRGGPHQPGHGRPRLGAGAGQSFARPTPRMAPPLGRSRPGPPAGEGRAARADAGAREDGRPPGGRQRA